MNKIINELLTISKVIGRDKYLIQGGGGNISIKNEKSTMYIKASGSFLRDMDEKKGYVKLKYKNIFKFFANLHFKDKNHIIENKITDYIENLVIKKGEKPSMEVSMHAFLDKYVIHTHPVYLNALLCSQNGRAIINNIFATMRENFIWIDYANPGYMLGYKIYKTIMGQSSVSTLNSLRETNKAKIYFLENHGLIVTGSKLRFTIQLTKKINFKAKEWFIENEILKEDLEFDKPHLLSGFSSKSFFFSNNPLLIRYGEKLKELKKILNTVLFPDFAVYCLGNFKYLDCKNKKNLNDIIKKINFKENSKIIFLRGRGVLYFASEKKADALHEILLSHIFIIDLIINNNNQPKKINTKDIKYILNMKMEKHRSKKLA